MMGPVSEGLKGNSCGPVRGLAHGKADARNRLLLEVTRHRRNCAALGSIPARFSMASLRCVALGLSFFMCKIEIITLATQNFDEDRP